MNPTTAAAMQRLADTVLSTDALLRLRIKRSLFAVPVYLVSTLLLQWAAARGVVDAAPAHGLSVYLVAGPILFYAAVRSGATLRLRDPALQLPQMAFGICGVLCSYVLNPPARSASLLLMTLVMSFGVFELRPRQAWGVCAVVLGSLGLLALALWCIDAPRFDGRVDALNFCVAAVVFPTLASLTARTHRLRVGLNRQRQELQNALHTVERLAMRDSLTGLANRRRLLQRLDDEITRQARSATGLCLVMIDIDHFKQINDRHGHAGGDWVLQRFAQAASASVRATDLLARWGGEEFLLMLPDAHTADARIVVERMLACLREPVTWAHHPERRVSVSAGLAEYRPGDSAAVLVERADDRLYAAKAAGRDQMVWA